MLRRDQPGTRGVILCPRDLRTNHTPRAAVNTPIRADLRRARPAFLVTVFLAQRSRSSTRTGALAGFEMGELDDPGVGGEA